MTDIDRYLTDAVGAGVQALRAAGLADADGGGFVLEGVYAHGAITVALEAALPDVIQQAKEEALREAETSADWQAVFCRFKRPVTSEDRAFARGYDAALFDIYETLTETLEAT